MLVSKPGSCFVDACQLALGVPADVLRAYIYNFVPESDCDNLGYHPTIVNIAMLELFKIGLSQIDPVPVDYVDGGSLPREGGDKITERLSSWFSRTGFRCVVQGPRLDNEQEHANAWNGSFWIDPADPGTQLDQPNVNIRCVWLTTLPPHSPAQTSPEEISDEEPSVDPS